MGKQAALQMNTLKGVLRYEAAVQPLLPNELYHKRRVLAKQAISKKEMCPLQARTNQRDY